MQHVSLNRCQEKKDMLKIIKNAMTAAYKERATKFILYYVGHGHEA